MVNEINYYTSSIYVVFSGEQNLVVNLDKYYLTPINYEVSNLYKDVVNLSLSSFI